MAKQDAYLLVGLPHAGLPVLTAALEQHRDALTEQGVRVPARSADEAFRAAVEVRREHKAWGVRRRDVEGTWAGISRRATKHASKNGETVVVGHELFAGAAPDEIDLLVDALPGFRVHVVVVVDAPDSLVGLVPSELDFSDVVTRWERAAKAPERVHVLVADGGPAAAWLELGRLDVRTLSLLAESTAALLDGDELEELVEHWAKVAADGGYDVRGDLAGLALPPAGPDVPLAALRSALAETVAEVGRLRGEVEELSAAARRPRLRSAR